MALLFNWRLSSKAPKPPLERLRAGCKPHGQSTNHAYIQPENVSPFQISKMYICATNDLANLSVENAFGV